MLVLYLYGKGLGRLREAYTGLPLPLYSLTLAPIQPYLYPSITITLITHKGLVVTLKTTIFFSCFCHHFSHASLLYKRCFELFNEAVEQSVGLMYKGNGYISNGFG